jgi:hypothetical protein
MHILSIIWLYAGHGDQPNWCWVRSCSKLSTLCLLLYSPLALRQHVQIARDYHACITTSVYVKGMCTRLNINTCSLMSVPCIAWLDVIDQHYALIIIPLFITQAPTCFGTYVPSSRSVLYPCELFASPKWLCHRDVPMYCKCWWPVCTGCCSFVRYFVQLSAARTKLQHSVHTGHHVHGYIPMTQTFRTFKQLTRIKDAPWRWHISGETCRSLSNK